MGRRRLAVEELPPEDNNDEETRQLLAALALSKETHRGDQSRAHEARLERLAIEESQRLADARQKQAQEVHAEHLLELARRERLLRAEDDGATTTAAINDADAAWRAEPRPSCTAIGAFVSRAAITLNEPPQMKFRLRRVTLALGLARANELLAATLDVEAHGGLLRTGGKKKLRGCRRTPGGTFFQLLKDAVPRDVFKAIYSSDNDIARRKRHNKVRGQKNARRKARLLARQSEEPTQEAEPEIGEMSDDPEVREPPDDPGDDDDDDLYDDDLMCPITLEIFVDPVGAADGFCYERSAIEAWFARPTKDGAAVLSPATGAPLAHLELVADSDRLARVSAL